MEFYSLKTRKSVQIPDSLVIARAIKQKSGRTTYAATANANGEKVFKFISKQEFYLLEGGQAGKK
ncbi:MAG: hypothetical protein FJ319_07570 [SAR202 cluster bacterium]|nr:hypothetical protein [SAR202 cluster bacterium]